MRVHVASQANSTLENFIACVTNELTFFPLTLPLCTFIWLVKPVVDPHTSSQNSSELPVSYCWNTSIKRIFVNLLSWDLIWLASPTFDRQTLLRTLQICSGCKSVEDRSQVLLSKIGLFDSLYFEHFIVFVDHFLPCWLIYYRLPPNVLCLYWALWNYLWRHP